MARDPARLTRRDLLSAATGADPVHISSAVVLARPEQTDAVIGRLSREIGIEVHGRNGPRIVVVMEAATAGRLGEMLTWITLMEGVISAAMVYEQRDVPEGAAS